MIIKSPIEEFKRRQTSRGKAITKKLILPNLVDEYTKSKMIIVFFFVISYFVFLEIRSLQFRHLSPINNKYINAVEDKLKNTKSASSKMLKIINDSLPDDLNNLSPEKKSKRILEAIDQFEKDGKIGETEWRLTASQKAGLIKKMKMDHFRVLSKAGQGKIYNNSYSCYF